MMLVPLLTGCQLVAPVDHRGLDTQWEAPGVYRVAPLVVGSLVVTLDADGRVTARDRRRGTQVWTRQVAGEGFANEMLQRDGLVLVPGVLLYALDAATGAERWVHAGTGGAAGVVEPAISGDTVFVGGHAGGEATALDLHTGQPLWSTPLGKFVFTPTVTDTLVVYPTRLLGEVAELIALDRATGDIRWRRELPDSAGRPGGTQHAGVQLGDRLVLGTSVAEALAVRLSDGSVLWRRSTGTSQLGGGYRYPALAVDGAALLLRGDGMHESFDPATGAVNWANQIGSTALSGLRLCGQHVCRASGKAWVLSRRGDVLWEGGGGGTGVFFLSNVTVAADGWMYAGVTYNDRDVRLIAFEPPIVVGATP
jgi:outer membrane protein assembly factor BamB